MRELKKNELIRFGIRDQAGDVKNVTKGYEPQEFEEIQRLAESSGISIAEAAFNFDQLDSSSRHDGAFVDLGFTHSGMEIMVDVDGFEENCGELVSQAASLSGVHFTIHKVNGRVVCDDRQIGHVSKPDLRFVMDGVSQSTLTVRGRISLEGGAAAEFNV